MELEGESWNSVGERESAVRESAVGKSAVLFQIRWV